MGKANLPKRSLPMTPGYPKLLPGTKVYMCCPKEVQFGPLHRGRTCTIVACYAHLIGVSLKGRSGAVYVVSPDYLKLYRGKKAGKAVYMGDLPIKTGELNKQSVQPKTNWDGTHLSELTPNRMKELGEQPMGKGDRKKRSHKKTAKTGRKALRKKIKKKKGKKAAHKRGSLSAAIYDFFDRVGLDKATYDKTLKVAKAAKPDTMFNRSHFSWYRNKYRLLRDID